MAGVVSERFYRLILAHPLWVIAAIATLTVFLGWQARRVELNSSIEAFFPEGHPAVTQDHEIKQVFDSRELILVALLNEDGVFNPRTLTKVRDLTQEIWGLAVATDRDAQRLEAWADRLGPPYQRPIQGILEDGLGASDRGPVNNLWIAIEEADIDSVNAGFRTFVDELRLKLSPVSDVISLAQVDNITATESGLDVHPPMSSVPESGDELAALTATVFENEMFVNGLVSEDSTGTVILVELSFYYDDHIDLAHALFRELEALASPYEGPEEVHLAGVPMVNVYTTKYMGGDLARLMPLVIVLVIVVMWFAFRTIKGALIPLAVVLVSIVWTLGVMAMVGRPLTLMTSVMPIILVAIGIADGIHVITEYQLKWARHRDRDQAIVATMRAMGAPVIFTSLTDMAGFGSLAISSVASIRDFGIFTSVGVLAALIFSLTFIPAMLKLMEPPHGRSLVTAGGRVTQFLERIGQIAIQHRRWVVIATVAASAVAALMLPRIQVGSRMVGYFKTRSKIVQASELINERFGGTEVLNVVIDTGRPDGLKEPEVLSKMAALQDSLEARVLVGYTTSLADYVRRIHYVMNNADPAFNRIPFEREQVLETDWQEVDGMEIEIEREVNVNGRDLIAQYLLLYENAGGDDILKLANFDYSKANVVAQIRTDHTPHLREVRQTAIDFAQREFAPDADVSFAGCSNLCIVADDLIIPSQLKSLGLALVVIAILLVLIFGSVRRGLFGLLPLVVTILMVFALLAAFGIFLDAVTALIASIVLGIGIDYSVHFLWRYETAHAKGGSVDAAVRETIVTSGRAIVFNSLAVATGFLVLLVSSFWPVIHIGWMVAGSMLIAAALALVLLPALLGIETRKAPNGQGEVI